MRIHWKSVSLSFLAVLVFTLFACSGTTTESTNLAEQETASVAQTVESEADTTYVQVQSIQDDAITAVVGTMTQPQAPSGDSAQQGTPSEMPSGDNSQQGTPPEMPSGDSAQQGPSSGALAQGGMMGFTAGDAVITFQVNDATVVTKQNGPESAEATLDDIAVGDILAVTISNDNIATAIVIQSAGMGGK